VTLLAFAADCNRRAAAAPSLSIDISCPPGPQQQTRRCGVRRPNDGTDGQTALDSFIDPAPHRVHKKGDIVRL